MAVGFILCADFVMAGVLYRLLKLKDKPIAGGIESKVLILTDEQDIII
jgi:hypothetical protein